MIIHKIYVDEMWGSEKETYKISPKKATQAFNNLVREEISQVYEPIGKEDFSEKVADFRKWESEYKILCRKMPLIIYKDEENRLKARIYSWGQPDYEYGEADIESKEVILEEIEINE